MSNLFKKGKIVLVLFLCFMVVGITNVYAEESINEVSVTGIKNPAIGDKAADIISDIKVSEGVNYTIDNITWWESENEMYFIGVDSLDGSSLLYTHNDHRIAMSLAVASTVCSNPLVIEGAECVKKSYPHFWDDFRKLGGDFDELA